MALSIFTATPTVICKILRPSHRCAMVTRFFRTTTPTRVPPKDPDGDPAESHKNPQDEILEEAMDLVRRISEYMPYTTLEGQYFKFLSIYILWVEGL